MPRLRPTSNGWRIKEIVAMGGCIAVVVVWLVWRYQESGYDLRCTMGIGKGQGKRVGLDVDMRAGLRYVYQIYISCRIIVPSKNVKL